ncbi:acetoacetate decarboxylase family protein [Phenylobacterium sp.]|jgi:hypothetical protein|uniref:acetoacetate decarboxylase family protein n=1 Tax=Phenylobacterium sp. TaxID=1871053 RepID=UPI002F92D9BA
MAAAPISYPPPPWRLTAMARVSFWLTRPPAGFEAPPGWRPVTVAGRLFVGVGLATYGPGGDLAYGELVCAVLVRRGVKLAVTIPLIWVDSPASRTGARALWAIPKELAEFQGAPPHFAATGGRTLAYLDAADGARAAHALPGRFTVVQTRAGAAVETPVRLRARVRRAEARWRLEGPLAFLSGERPLFSLRLEDARLVFGEAPATVR